MGFSILTLLAATGYVALLIAGIQDTDSWWRHVGTVVWLLTLAFLLMLATDVHSRAKAVFGRVAIGCVVIYLMLTWLPPESLPGTNTLPHHWFVRWWVDSHAVAPTPVIYTSWDASVQSTRVNPPVQPAATNWMLQVPAVQVLAIHNFALAFGVAGGFLALWRYRRQERNTQKP